MSIASFTPFLALFIFLALCFVIAIFIEFLIIKVIDLVFGKFDSLKAIKSNINDKPHKKFVDSIYKQTDVRDINKL